MTIGLFEAIEITGQALVMNIIELLDQYGLRKKIIARVKDERSNLNVMTTTLKSIVKCEILGLDESFHGTCFGHVLSKTFQYATTNEKVCKNLWFISSLPN